MKKVIDTGERMWYRGTIAARGGRSMKKADVVNKHGEDDGDMLDRIEPRKKKCAWKITGIGKGIYVFGCSIIGLYAFILIMALVRAIFPVSPVPELVGFIGGLLAGCACFLQHDWIKEREVKR